MKETDQMDGNLIMQCDIGVEKAAYLVLTAAQLHDVDMGLVAYDCPEQGLFPHADCDKYYVCSGRSPQAHLWKCDGDYVFDLRRNMCRFPEESTECGK